MFSEERPSCTPLSRTFQSSQLLTPRDLRRITIDDKKYANFQKEALSRPPLSGRTPGSRPFTYGEHPILVERDHPTSQQYTNTSLKLSEVRAHDQIVPRPLSSFSVINKTVMRPYPSEHPYSSHQERFKVFPDTRRLDSIPPLHDSSGEVTICRVIDRAQFKCWRREQVMTYRPRTAHESVSQLRGTYEQVVQRRHKRSATYPFVTPLHHNSHTLTYLPPVTPNTQQGLCSLHDAMMRTSYNSHYEMPLNQDTNVLLIEDNPSILENEEEDEEAGEEDQTGSEDEKASSDDKEEGELQEGVHEDREKRRTEKQKNSVAEGERKVKEGQNSIETEQQDGGRSGEVKDDLRQKSSAESSFLPSICPPTASTQHQPSSGPRKLISSGRYAELCSQFSRTEAMRRHHNRYPDELPDPRESCREGRRHIINGYHAYYYH